MKRILLTLTILSAALTMVAKDPKPCPSDYYAIALNKSDQALLTALYNIITSHTDIGYDNLWSAYADTDTDSRGYYIDMYSTYDKYTYSNKCGSYSAIGDCINREHSVPKSWWGGGKQDQYSDIFNIVPTDGYVNNQRSNYPYGVCEGGTRLTNGNYIAKGRMGYSTRSGYTGRVFEPDDEYKGDFARAYFYMATCYNNIISNWTQAGGSAFFAGNSYPAFTTYAINLLLEWHRLDPVSEKETKRNNYAHAWQGNRNPYIDHPELAEYSWGNKTGQKWTGDGSVVVTPVLSQPSSNTSINVGTIAVDATSVSKNVTVKGTNFTSPLAVSVSGQGFTVTPTTLSANAINDGTTVTVTYSGNAESATGTLTLTNSDVTRTVALTASKTQPDTPEDPVTPTGEYSIETWENTETGGYWTREVQGAAYKWYFSNAGIFAQTYDHWRDEIGCRFGKNNNSYIAMNEDVAGTSGLSFYAATYGTTEADATLQVLYSTNSGSTWTLLEELNLTHELVQYTIGLDERGDIRFKFQQTAGQRLNIDDIAIYAPLQEVKDPKIYFGGSVQAMTAVQDESSSISEVTVLTEDNEDAVTVSVSGNFELSLNQRSWSNSLTLDASGETFYVRMKSTATIGECDGVITATAGSVTAYANVEGEVTAPAVLAGDVNMDGIVNISDVTTLIDYLLGNEVYPFNTQAADMASDGIINISDVTTLIDHLLGNSAAMWNALPTTGGILIENPASEMLEIYDLDANVVATVNATVDVELPAGTYMVTSDTRSRKVVVK